jgi:hypothetical protein
MSQAEARAWWADVEHLRERIEGRRELESSAHDREPSSQRGERSGGTRARRSASAASTADPSGFAPRRTVRIRGQAIPTVTAPRLHVVDDEPDFLTPAWQAAQPRAGHGQAPAARRRPRRTAAERVGSNPDRIAMWAVMLGIALVLAALLSAHGL